ncbi:MAG: tetratricopeptide repeat protein [Acidobacteria bacterium]|nr:tetratricopeptide repeat protein [Acidobacteriota bacterium]
MPTGRKHLTRHEMLKQDEFVSWVSHATMWIESNRRAVVAGLIGVVVVVAAGLGISAWQRSKADEAYTRLGDVQKIARTPIAGEPGAAPGALQTSQERSTRIVAAADRLLAASSSGEAADWARYHRASALLDLGRKDEAATALAPVLGGAPGTLLGDLSNLLAGRIEEARGNLQKAADTYAAAAEKSGKSFPPELALADQARCLAALGKKQEAITAYQKILDVYPESPLAGKANQKLQELKGAS